MASVVIALLAIAANFAGTRVLSRVTELGVWTGLAGLAIIGGYMLLFARVQPFSILFYSYGLAKGGYAPALLIASLIGIWIFYGFEACGDLAEEVEGASHKVPRAMIMTVICGGGSALLMTLGLLLAIPDMAGGLNGNVADPAGAPILKALGPIGAKFTLVCLIAVVTSGTASVIASTSRLLFSLGRDGVIFGAAKLAVIDPRRGLPMPALWVTSNLTVVVLAIGFISANAVTQIISFATAGIYTAFQMVVLASLVAAAKGWHAAGVFRLVAAGYIVKLGALAYGIAAILNLAWPRTPSAGWFANWLIVISMAVIVILGLLQLPAVRLNKREVKAA
jgi:amino acid transporter